MHLDYQLTLWFQHKYNLQSLSLSIHPYSSPIYKGLGFSREVYRAHTIGTSIICLAAACWRKRWVLRECGNGSIPAMQSMESRANPDHPKNLAVSVLLIAIPEAYLVSPRNINYLALSYVWGPQPESTSNVDNTDDGHKLLPSNVP
jgi:hypothetical protein